MQSIPLDLPDQVFIQLETDSPRGPKNNSTRDRAVGIVKYWLSCQLDTKVFLVPKEKGADISYSQNGITIHAEIKGTEDKEIALEKFKVSGVNSYRVICEGGPVFRVCDVFSRMPVIHILKIDEDFKLVQEPRWRVKKLSI
jgi:hypothetical protein